jgi:mRNA interferase MazF
MRLPRSQLAHGVWDIVRVPFPYTDRRVRQRRPALIVAIPGMQAQLGLLWVLMITSADNRGWPGDVLISDLLDAGLPVQSLVRTEKIATMDARDAERIGCLPEMNRQTVTTQLRRHLAGVGSSSR